VFLAAPVLRAANVQFTGAVSTDFTLAGNWADGNPPAADGDVHFVDNGLTADLTGTASVSHVVVGDVATGVLNVTGGTRTSPAFPAWRSAASSAITRDSERSTSLKAA
jgi:hypothetical protein